MVDGNGDAPHSRDELSPHDGTPPYSMVTIVMSKEGSGPLTVLSHKGGIG